MKNIVFYIVLVCATTLFAYEDSDFDGVEDSLDICPDTPFTDLVNIKGCSIKSLVSAHHFDIIVGTSYSDSDYKTLNATDTLSSNVQLDYYYKDFSLQFATSYFTTNGSGYSDNGLNDSFIGASYQIKPNRDLYIRVGAGALLPSYKTSLNNNKTDYLASINVSYIVDKITLFASYSYTMINDEDTVIVIDANTSTNVKYQNSNAVSMGLGYYLSDKTYLSVAYNSSDSIYVNVEDIETASLYGYHSFDENWFCTLSYARGISDSASTNYGAFRVGYYF